MYRGVCSGGPMDGRVSEQKGEQFSVYTQHEPSPRLLGFYALDKERKYWDWVAAGNGLWATRADQMANDFFVKLGPHPSQPQRRGAKL